LFKKSESLEDFEKKLNNESNNVNNLDLNEDGKIDYIRVVDNVEKDAHAIVLQVPVSEKENQDVAVITLEKTGNEQATLQIIGDEDVYGEEKIVEPFEEEKQKGGKNGPSPDLGSAYVVVNVWFWAPVRYVYHPSYVVYRSPWGWAVYPTYWRPWTPYPYYRYYPRVSPYHVHYHSVTVVRCPNAHGYYGPRRTYSTTVHTRTTTYKTTRTTTTKTTTTNGRQPAPSTSNGRQPSTSVNNQPSKEAAPATSNGRQPATTNQPTKETSTAPNTGRQPSTTNQPTKEATPSKKPTSTSNQVSKEATPSKKPATTSSTPSKSPSTSTSKKQTKQTKQNSGAKQQHTGPRNRIRQSGGRQ
jgi:hypothetical protein